MIEIAILGLGTVGGGTADLLESHKESIARRVGDEIHIKYILDIRELPESPYYDRIVHDYNLILNDPEVQIVAEVIGGSHPAYEFTCQAFDAGKHVVTSNKEVVATFGDELLARAAKNGVRYLFEASVGGGVPIIKPLQTDLAANDILEISGIMNGTTNYILTRMFGAGISFAEALGEAKAKGYAEADPTADVDGIDACRKIAILHAISSGQLIEPARIHTEGISAIRSEDVRAARSFGAEIKLLGRTVSCENKDTFIMVAPFLIDEGCPLAHVHDVFNGILVRGSAVGDVMFYGRGAGALPTASAVCSDILSLAKGASALPLLTFARTSEGPTDFGFFSCRRYLALKNTDENAVRVIFGANTSVTPDEESDELWVMTEEMTENAFLQSVSRLESSGASLLSHIRVY
ncbi:MAG: homoserine dehydrogenase [Clostridia bacterium]|nr:homoserine dehydrogenase [Clostridia bacterium]